MWENRDHVVLVLGPGPDPAAGDVAAIIGGDPGRVLAVPGRMWKTVMGRYFRGASGSFRSWMGWSM